MILAAKCKREAEAIVVFLFHVPSSAKWPNTQVQPLQYVIHLIVSDPYWVRRMLRVIPTAFVHFLLHLSHIQFLCLTDSIFNINIDFYFC